MLADTLRQLAGLRLTEEVLELLPPATESKCGRLKGDLARESSTLDKDLPRPFDEAATTGGRTIYSCWR